MKMEENSRGQGRKQGFERKLAIYAVAGGAVLAWPGSVPAEVIYSGLLNKTLPEISANLGIVGSYDLQTGGTKQFTVAISGGSGQVMAGIVPSGSNSVLSSDKASGALGIASPFGAGSSIGANAYFVGNMFKSGDRTASAPAPGYYGLLFDWSANHDHYFYGWVLLADFRTIDFYPPPEMLPPGIDPEQLKQTMPAFTLVDWAYQNEQDVAIGAGEGRAASVPEPSTLSLLAMGALGLAAWRSRKQDGKNS
jgi:hypothetical protein